MDRLPCRGHRGVETVLRHPACFESLADWAKNLVKRIADAEVPLHQGAKVFALGGATCPHPLLCGPQFRGGQPDRLKRHRTHTWSITPLIGSGGKEDDAYAGRG